MCCWMRKGILVFSTLGVPSFAAQSPIVLYLLHYKLMRWYGSIVVSQAWCAKILPDCLSFLDIYEFYGKAYAMQTHNACAQFSNRDQRA